MNIAFLLKKIVSAFIMPLPIGLFIALIGLYYLYKNHYVKAKILLSISFLFITIISYNPFANVMLAPLENQYKKLTNIPQDINYILLLGGDRKNRGWEVLRLHNQLPNAKIITSGYKAKYSIAEATRTANILKQIGIPSKSIIIHNKPKDTKEEANAIKKLLGKEKFILVTSAYHMPRAMALFKKGGLNPIAAPTDFKIKPYNTAISMPDGNSLKHTQLAWHEYLGKLWSKIRGQI